MTMKILVILLTLLLLQLQYALWWGQGSYREVKLLQKKIAERHQENEKLKLSHEALFAEIQDLKKGGAAIEERARMELGMIKKGEIFYQIIEK